ncbi:MAG TPA: PolC-type DNA polymerase III, partial [Feifaniaceae bacterium]|nr:PolC-type DNA polymerase III [Feifaniaceae bacterium]
CPSCRHSEFDVDRTKYACGVDMPDKNCPVCGTKYEKAGYEIPFEVFLGFHGDKTPDIDLNFSGEYQPVAHKYTEEMFGDGHAFRAGTISGVQTKTAYGYVMKYLEKMNMTVTRHEIDRLCEGCSGVKRTTGQHPGGIVIVPKENDILEFTPVQYPADQKQKNTITTHFDFHALDDRLVKLDILGHDDPTALKMLNDLTGLDPRSIPLDDKDTMSIYSSSERLSIDLTPLGGCEVGSLGIPEFGTSFVRQMLMDTRPTTMEELVRIAGLSHGTDVWLNNAQTLVLNGTATLSEVICTRDDIMNYLIACGCEPSISFKTMENVRKGKGLTDDMKAAMLKQNVPAWFIDSCEKIKYMFPRAHAVAYVMMSYRIAYYKVHYPKAFYAVYYTVRADAFDVRYAVGGAARVLKNIREIEAKGKDASNQEADLLTILEVVYEMNLRGIQLLPVDIYKSDAVNFLIEEEGIRAPFNAVGGVGRNAAVAISENKGSEKFLSIEDFQSRTGANSAVINALTEAGCFEALPKSNQLSLF